MQLANKRKFLTGTVLLIATALFLLCNIASHSLLQGIRLDLTQNKIYTLSAGSKEIIQQLSEPVTLRFYFSTKIGKINPYLQSFAIRVQDMLMQYVRSSGGKITLEIIDPEPFSVAEDQAVNYGLRGIAADNSGTEYYLGLVGSNDQQQTRVIPVLQPTREENLEYDLSQLLHNLSNPTVRTIGILSGVPLQTKNGRPLAIMQQIAQNFVVQNLDPALTSIAESLGTLMLVQPQYLSVDTLRAIDNFVMRGGHLLGFIDPNYEAAESKAPTQNLDLLLQSWGVELQNDKVVADRTLAKAVRLIQDGQESMIRYPFWLDFSPVTLAKRDVITANLERITLATPGALTKRANGNIIFSPLITTSKEAMLVDRAKISEYQRNLNYFLHNYQASGEYVVAARISGPISSAYQENTSGLANIVLIADADLLQDQFWLTGQNVPIAANGNLVLNALDNLSSGDALISIRNRGSFIRPFATIAELQLESQRLYRESEQSLQQKLILTKTKIQQLEQQRRGDNSKQLTLQQKLEEDAFRQELLQTRRELREVRRKLNQTIEKVETKVKFYSIGFMPLLIILTSLFVWGWQLRRQRPA